MVVRRTGPEADHIRAELIDDVGGIDTVAEGLVHGLALTVHSPAVGQALAVGSALPQRADSNQQRGLEPAAVLVAALHVHGGGPEALIALHGAVVGRAGVKPAVKSVGFFREVDTAAVGALEALWQQLRSVHIKPCVAALLFEDTGNGLDSLVSADGLMAILAVEHGDGQTPAALTGDAPVAALADHGAHAILAPGRQPAHVFAGGHGVLLEGVDRAEPLGSGAEDNGALAAPAVGIAVNNILGGKEHTALFHVVKNDGVGFVGGHTGVLAGVIGVATLIVNRNDHFHTVAHTGQIVVRAEAGRGVDAARTGIHSYIVRQKQAGGLVEKGVPGKHILIEAALVRLDELVLVKAADIHDLFRQILCHDEHFAVGRLDDGIGSGGVQRDGQVSGQGPDSGRPDEEGEL